MLSVRQLTVATLLILGLSILAGGSTRANEQLEITRLALRDRVIVISSSPNGPLYSIGTKDGAVLDANLSIEELQAKYPDVYEKVQPAVADGEAGLNTIWAGM